jgi:hypothetical protein
MEWRHTAIVWGSRSRGADDSGLQERYALSSGTVMCLYLQAKLSLLRMPDPNDEDTIILRNVDNYRPVATVPYPEIFHCSSHSVAVHILRVYRQTAVGIKTELAWQSE